ncbi:MAG: hypothetical protein GW867_00465, partial [Armatimonadetes bacterium]|nr:hypothetical protein [Armatimonadota bacterium]
MPLPDAVAQALTEEVELLMESAEEGVAPAPASRLVAASLRAAGLTEAQAAGCAALLVDACFRGNADLVDDVFAALRDTVAEGATSLGSSDLRYLAARFAKLAGVSREQAKVAIAVLAASVGVGLTDSAVATTLLSSPASIPPAPTWEGEAPAEPIATGAAQQELRPPVPDSAAGEGEAPAEPIAAGVARQEPRPPV